MREAKRKKTQFIIHVDIFYQGKRVYDQKWMIWNGWRTFGALCILSSTKIIHFNQKMNTEYWNLKSLNGTSVVTKSRQRSLEYTFHQINMKTIWLKPWHRNGSSHFTNMKQIIDIVFVVQFNQFPLIDSNLHKTTFTEYFNGGAFT